MNLGFFAHIVLADEPASSGVNAKIFNHLLGECGVTFCAQAKLAKKLRRGFPKSLDGAPALLPMANTGLRRSIEKWFHTKGIRPRLVGECEDPAMLHVLGFHGLGFIPVATLVANEAAARFGFGVIGRTEACRQRFYAITPERRMTHPAVTAMTSDARERLFAKAK